MTKGSHKTKCSVSVREDHTGMENRVYIDVSTGRNRAHLYRSVSAESVNRNSN